VIRTHAPNWWRDPQDVRPQGDPETEIVLPSGQTIKGLRILGVDGDVMLGVKTSADGRFAISCAVTTEIQIEYSPINTRSNPRRHQDEGDGA
jgi:hypothetical protein